MKTKSSKPFLKWAGGKSRLLRTLLPLLPPGKRLIEPFVGAGSVFLASPFERFVLADINPVMIALYRRIQSDAPGFVRELRPYFTETNRSMAAYCALRERYNDPATAMAERVLLFVYLNKFSFNGLYRTNQSGGFNVSYGKPEYVPSMKEEAILGFAERLQHAELFCEDFANVMDRAQLGDVVYCDPPYADQTDMDTFSEYSSAGFGWSDQVRLANKARELAERGISVAISNHDTDPTRSLYLGAKLHSLSVRRSIAADSTARGRAQELVAIFSPH
jgi:DNA adenine methylase